jgi:type II secretory pathway pseudopilin PulG
LLEITIVLFIVGLLIAGLLAPLETQLESRDRRQTIETLNQIADALYGYAITNGRLPCPDKDDSSSGARDGRSDPAFDPANTSTAVCSVTVGLVPYADLGVPPGDAWGNRIRYAVTSPNYTRPEADGLCNGNSLPDPHFDLCTKGKLKINTRGDNPATGPQESKFLTTLADEIPAVLISHGRNGFGATTIAGTVLPPPSGNDEAENSDNDGTFISRGYSKGSSACTDDNNESTPLCEFDDIVVWLSPTILNAKMVSAGRLP